MMDVKDKEEEEKKNGCCGCLGCLGLLLLIAILFGACGAFFGDEEDKSPEEEITQEQQDVVKVDEERKAKEQEAAAEKEKQEKEAQAKEKAEAEQKAKEEAERIAKEETEKESLASSDKNCGDFSNHAEVLEFWIENGYSAENDPHELDRDRDGLPCDIAQSEYDNQLISEDSFDVPESGTTSDSDSNIYYDNCTAVRDAGADPIQAGDIGYGGHLDRDGDGIACE